MTTPTTSDYLADPAELADRLGVAETDPSMLSALRSATARFRAAVRHPVSLIENDTVLLDGDGSRSLVLPAAPVVSVSTVHVGDHEVSDYRWSRAGLLRRDAGWPDELGVVEVTYSHGHDPIPEEIADVVLNAAETAFTGAQDVASMTVGGQQVTFRQGTSATWSTVVDLYRLNRGDRW